MNMSNGPALRAMIWKETKENAKWAILALLGISLALVFTIVHQMGGNAVNSLPAVWDSAGLVMTFGAPLVGLAFGLLQILPELRRDQWAFLVHRPAPRATLFWGKAITGMCLTLLATLIPLLGLALWAAAPGHLAAPFDPRLLLGGLAAILTGLTFYTAGLLTALRPARWYASRALPVAMALVCALLVAVSSEFLGAVIRVALFLTVLLTAARGSFLTTGTYQRQPRPAKFTLGVTLFLGMVVTLVAVGAVIGSTISTLFPARQEKRHWSYTYYAITQTGRILRVTRTDDNDDNPVAATDLNGHPVPLPHSGNQSPAFYDDFLQEQEISNSVGFDQENYNSPKRYAAVLGTAGQLDNGTIWYYVPSQQRVQAYSLDTHRLIGSLGPSGFSTDDRDTSRFPGPLAALIPNGYDQKYPLLAFPHALYLLDPYGRRLQPLLITPQRISGIDKIQSFSRTIDPATGTAYVVTVGNQFSLFSAQGQPLFTIPREAAHRTYPVVTAAMTSDHKLFFFRYFPQGRENADHPLPSLITEVTATGTVVGRHELPPIPSPPATQSPLTSSLYGLLAPPAFTLAVNIVGYSWHHSHNNNDLWDTMTHERTFWLLICLCSLLGGLFSGLAAWHLGRRCVFSRGGHWAWTVGVFWLGLPGLLLLLSLRDWPAREPCPNCGRGRVVDQEQCEHCGAGFAAPLRDGTEIFEDSPPSGASALSLPASGKGSLAQ